MFVNFKITTWERVFIPSGTEDRLLKLIQDGEISSSMDLFNEDENCKLERLGEYDEQMSIENNDGQATLEVYNESGDLLYQNASWVKPLTDEDIDF